MSDSMKGVEGVILGIFLSQDEKRQMVEGIKEVTRMPEDIIGIISGYMFPGSEIIRPLGNQNFVAKTYYGEIMIWPDRNGFGKWVCESKRENLIENVIYSNGHTIATTSDNEVMVFENRWRNTENRYQYIHTLNQNTSVKDIKSLVVGDRNIFILFNDGIMITINKNDNMMEHVGGVCSIHSKSDQHVIVLESGEIIIQNKVGHGYLSDIKDVKKVSSNYYAFAALLKGGEVMAWGNQGYGGDIESVKESLKDVVEIKANTYSFAALTGSGNVVTWGDSKWGGDPGEKKDMLKNVKSIYSASAAYAALLENGRVITWGDQVYGGNSDAAQHLLKNVRSIHPSWGGFTATLDNGRLVTWGKGFDPGFVSGQTIDPGFVSGQTIDQDNQGIESQIIESQIIEPMIESKQAVSVCSTQLAFAAILGDRSVVTWGKSDMGGDSEIIKNMLKGVEKIVSNTGGFAAKLYDGNIVVWGAEYSGGYFHSITRFKKNNTNKTAHSNGSRKRNYQNI